MVRVTMFSGRRAVFNGMAKQVVLPTDEGEVSVLDFHAPMLCALAPGEVQIDETVIPVHRGIARVERNVLTMLVR